LETVDSLVLRLGWNPAPLPALNQCDDLRLRNAGMASLQGHKALIFGENVLYMVLSLNIAPTAPAGAIFSVRSRGVIIEGVQPTREQWQEKRVIIVQRRFPRELAGGKRSPRGLSEEPRRSLPA